MPGRAPSIVFVVVPVVLVASVVVPSRSVVAAASRAGYQPPVDAPVIDPYRPPASRYAAGNRGIEYATEPGTVVRAAGDGTVLFAGSVAGTLHLTLRHPDGLRTSYSFLQRVDVVVGQRVRRGQPVGSAGDRLHLGVRDPTGTYLDPAALFAGAVRGRARLVPGADDGAPALVRERASFLQLVVERGMALTEGARLDARLALHYAVQLRPDVRASSVVTRVARRMAQQRRCTPTAPPSPPSARGRVVLLVGGLGSTSERAAVDEVDTGALGYAPADVVRFSYVGGLVPDEGDAEAFAGLPRHPYDDAAATGDLDEAARRLEAVLSALAAARPGVPIDVVAHSQGGLVARLAIATADERGALPGEVATLATIGTPHEGADLATAADATDRVPGAGAVATSLAAVDPTRPAVRQLGELSDFVARVGDAPLPPGLHRVSIAARGDLVVPVPRTMDRAFPSAVVPLAGRHAHDELPGHPGTTAELGLAIQGLGPTCVPVSRLVADAVAGEAVSWATDAAGAALLAS